MKQLRKNRLMAARVEKGIRLKETVSTRQAAVYLASGGVPLDVALRVLTTPYKRDMRAELAAPPSWQDIIMSSGPTFGLPVSNRDQG